MATTEVEGFAQSQCDGKIQSKDEIGFWCDHSGDGSVLMIGGGGNLCGRAVHGIGITGADEAKFRVFPNFHMCFYNVWEHGRNGESVGSP